MPQQLKGLFVTPVITPSGSTRSLATLIENDTQNALTVAIPCSPIDPQIDLEQIRQQWFPQAQQVLSFHLPKDFSQLIGRPKGAKALFNTTIRYGLWRAFRHKFYRHLKEHNYDFIHLNSVVLYPLLTRHYPMFLHVREPIETPSRFQRRRFAMARGVVAIDKTTHNRIESLSLTNTLILNNPFDMRSLKNLYGSEELAFKNRCQIGPENTVFSVLGAVEPARGVDFLIRAFLEVKNPKVRLLIAGTGPNSYLQHCQKIASQDPRILFLGEIKDPRPLYLITDTVLRGHAFFALGRSLFEGLYAGCHVIMTGNRSAIASEPTLLPFEKVIHFFPPKDLHALSKQMELTSYQKVKTDKRCFLSNTKEYVEQFYTFIKSSISKNL